MFYPTILPNSWQFLVESIFDRTEFRKNARNNPVSRFPHLLLFRFFCLRKKFRPRLRLIGQKLRDFQKHKREIRAGTISIKLIQISAMIFSEANFSEIFPFAFSTLNEKEVSQCAQKCVCVFQRERERVTKKGWKSERNMEGCELHASYSGKTHSNVFNPFRNYTSLIWLWY